MIELGGQSYRQGIIFRSNNHEIDVKTFPNIEIGDVKRSEIAKKDNRRFMIIFPLIMVLLITDEIRSGNDPVRIFISSILGMFVVMVIIAIIIYYSHRFGIKSFHHIRMNHGAEHKAMAAYINGKIEDIDKVSRFVKMCGGNIAVPIVVMMIFGGLIRYPVTLAVAYYLCYMYVRPIRNVLFKTVGVPVQFITTEEPSPEILEAAKIGLLKLVNEEEKETKQKESGQESRQESGQESRQESRQITGA